MMRNMTIAFLTSTLCVAAASAQATAESATATQFSSAAISTTPAAWVYVSSTPAGSSTSQIEGFVASPNGMLTAIPGSPFKENVANLAVNGKYLFGTASNGNSIDAYWMEGNGTLTYTATTNTALAGDCNPLGPLFLDHTGATLYDMEFRGAGCLNNTYASFTVVKSTGKLTFLGDAGHDAQINGVLSFIGNDKFAYSSDCYHFSSAIYGFQRNSNGSLTDLNIAPAIPTAPSGLFYCPYLAAADPTSHLAVPVQAYTGLELVPQIQTRV